MELTGEQSVAKLKKLTFYALLAETFFIAISPALALAALIAGIVCLLIRSRLDRDFSFQRTPFDLPIAVFAVFSLISVTVSPNMFFSIYNFTFTGAVYILSFILAVQTIEDEKQLKFIAGALAAAALVVVLYGYYQYFFGINVSDVKWVDAEAFPELKKRVFSTWQNPNILAGYLNEVICLVLGFFVFCEKKKERLIYLAGMILLAACLAMTYARGACLALAIVIAGYGAVKDRRILFGCIGIGVVILLLNPMLAERLASVFTKMDTSSEMRLALWESTVAMIEENPLFGIGWGAYSMVYHSYDFYINDPSVLIVHAHNVYLNYMAEIGIVGGLCYFVFFFGTVFRILYMKEKYSTFIKSLRLGIALALITVALGGMTDDVLFNIPTSMLFWLLCGIAIKTEKI